MEPYEIEAEVNGNVEDEGEIVIGGNEQGDIEDILDADDKQQYEKIREQEKEKYIHETMAKVEELKQKKEEQKETQFMLEQEELYESTSGLALRAGRILHGKELEKIVEGKKYVDLDSIESTILPGAPSGSQYYTIGVLCKISNVKISKVKTTFVTWVFSSLKKVAEAKPSELAKLKVRNGYRTISAVIYGDFVSQLRDEKVGTIYAIINPLAMPKSEEYDYSLKIARAEQLRKIGMSLDFDYCRHYNKAIGKRCGNFVNAAIEKFCELHVDHKLDTIKSKRPIFQSTYLDINKVKKNRDEDVAGNPFKRNSKKKEGEEPLEMSKEAKEKHDKWQAEESNKLNAYMKKRLEVNTTKSSNPMKKLLTQQALAKHATPAKASAQGKDDDVELDLNAEPEVDTDFIKKLMEKKKKQTFSEKFADSAVPLQEDKKNKPDI